MSRRERVSTALTIAGSDSGGGAGVQADLKTFAALGVYGTSAITCITAQNPRRVLGIQACRPSIVRQQIEAVFAELRPNAVKTGMLYSTEIIRVIANCFEKGRHPPVVVDPVMVSTSGALLLKPSAVKELTERLLPLAALITPNVDEAEILVGDRLTSVEGLRSAARQIQERYGCAALVKGGHLRGGQEAVDIFFDGRTELMLSAPFVRGVSTHGTGCTYSAAVAAWLARGATLVDAVVAAKKYITRAIGCSNQVRRHSVLNHGFGLRMQAGLVGFRRQ